MSGFDNGTLQGGVYFQAKQFGPIIRGIGQPVPQAGVVGDLYMADNGDLYTKRTTAAQAGVDPWGHSLFNVAAPYRANMKWFGAAPPAATLGVNGDYFLLWGGYPNYGMQPSIYGPKAAGAWPVNPVNVGVAVNPLYGAQDTHGI